MINQEGRNSSSVPNIINLDCRRNLSVSGVKEVDSFDDRIIEANTSMGKLLIKGINLNIKKLNLDVGDLEINGKINSLEYLDSKVGNGGNILKKLFK